MFKKNLLILLTAFGTMQAEILDEATQFCTWSEMPLLSEQKAAFADDKPFAGLKIYHNVPLTMETVLKIHALIAGGAIVTVSNVAVVPAHPQAVAILQKAGVKLDLKKELPDVPYDVYLDCCGELSTAPAPKLGTVELTQSGSTIYRNANLLYPVISVDDSALKKLETVGTGQSFVIALQELTGKDLSGQKVVVFGYGKVGQGIVTALKKFTDQIIVVDLKRIEGLTSYAIDEKAAICAHFQDAFCVVTATGVESLMSKYFDPEDFHPNVYLANMGGIDEFGPQFEPSRVLFNKQPINFALASPTPRRFLDPIFCAHNSSIELLRNLAPGYHPLPEANSTEWIVKWSNYHME